MHLLIQVKYDQLQPFPPACNLHNLWTYRLVYLKYSDEMTVIHNLFWLMNNERARA